MRIKESNVHTFMEVGCGCGETAGPDTESPFRWFKVNGVQTCEQCLNEFLREIEFALEVE